MNFLQLRESEQEAIIASLMEHARISAEESPSWNNFFTDLTAHLLTIMIGLTWDSAHQSMVIAKAEHDDKYVKLESIAHHFSLNRKENDVYRFMAGMLFCISIFVRTPEEIRYLVWKLFVKSVDALQTQYTHDFLAVSIRNPQTVYGGYAMDEVSVDYFKQEEVALADFEDIDWMFAVE